MAKKKSSNAKIDSLCSFLLVIVLVCFTLFIWHSHSFLFQTNIPEDQLLDSKKYEDLLLKAKELTTKYKTLTADHEIINGNSHANLQVPSTEHQQSSKFFSSSSFQKDMGVFPKDSLILGMALDTDPKNMAVFCKSLRSVSTATVVIFVNNPIPERHQKIATESDITLIGFDVESLEPKELRHFHPSTIRWPLFLNLLTSNPEYDKYGRIWMIDVRDSFFQGDPFSFVSRRESSFHVFHGVETMTIQQCGWNSGWIKDCFGEGVLRQVGNNRIICSGVSVGTRDTVLHYLQKMNDNILGINGANTKFPQCERNGVDQGVHNVLVHQKELLNVKEWSQFDGPVLNLQARQAVVRDGKVSNRVGEKVPVVHQYDRNPLLQSQLFSKYVDWVNTNDFESMWQTEAACQKFEYKQNYDLFKGVCDLSSRGGATSASSCCGFCLKQPGCRAFTFFGGQCFLKKCQQTGSRAVVLKDAVSGYFKAP